MTLSTALTKSYKGWPFVETVTLELRHGPDPLRWQQVECTRALPRAISSSRQFFAGVVIQGDERVWNVADDELQSGNPDDEADREIKIGDRIIEAALVDVDDAKGDQVRWQVISVQRVSHGTRWRCVCRPELS